MKKILLTLAILLLCWGGYAQTGIIQTKSDPLIRLTPIPAPFSLIGTIYLSATDTVIYFYNGTAWIGFITSSSGHGDTTGEMLYWNNALSTNIYEHAAHLKWNPITSRLTFGNNAGITIGESTLSRYSSTALTLNKGLYAYGWISTPDYVGAAGRFLLDSLGFYVADKTELLWRLMMSRNTAGADVVYDLNYIGDVTIPYATGSIHMASQEISQDNVNNILFNNSATATDTIKGGVVVSNTNIRGANATFTSLVDDATSDSLITIENGIFKRSAFSVIVDTSVVLFKYDTTHGTASAKIGTKYETDTLAANIYDTLQKHSDTTQSHNVRILALNDTCARHLDSLQSHNIRLLALIDSTARHTDTLQSHNLRINAGTLSNTATFDSLAIHLDTLQSHNTRLLAELDSLTRHTDTLQSHNSRINVIKNALGDTANIAFQNQINIFTRNNTFSKNVYIDTSSATTGIIYQNNIRFIHSYKHPTGGGAIPVGYNTCIGGNSGNLTMGSTATNTNHASYNSLFGYGSGYSMTTGYYNTFNGMNAGYNNTTGYQNTALGAEAFTIGTTFTNSTAIGYDAEPTTSNQVVIGNSSVTHTIISSPVIRPADTTGFGSTTNIGMIVYKISDNHFYGLKGGILPIWVQLDN